MPGRLSAVRTVLFWGLATVWFTEMTFLGFQTLSKIWSYLWQVPLPENPQLVTALAATWSVGSPEKGALGVMAVLALKSRNASVRTALFIGMALVPALNIAFPFRQQGFLLGPVTVATVLSMILWGGFFLFPEPVAEGGQKQAAERSPFSRSEVFQHAWFAFYAAVVTAFAILFLFWPRAALDLWLPCASDLLAANDEALPSLIHTDMASGTHLLAVAISFWIGTCNLRRNPVLRRALTIAGIAHAGLFLVFPLRQIAFGFGAECAAASILIAFVPLLVGWIVYAALTLRAEPPKTAQEIRSGASP
jgi:hypothetical protein